MTIIFQFGGNFWIEFVQLPTIVLVDAAGHQASTDVTLERPGIFVGGSIFQRGGADNDNTQAIGSFSLREGGDTALIFGDNIVSVNWAIDKEAGTAGNTNANANALVFMRKSIG